MFYVVFTASRLTEYKLCDVFMSWNGSLLQGFGRKKRPGVQNKYFWGDLTDSRPRDFQFMARGMDWVNPSSLLPLFSCSSTDSFLRTEGATERLLLPGSTGFTERTPVLPQILKIALLVVKGAGMAAPQSEEQTGFLS